MPAADCIFPAAMCGYSLVVKLQLPKPVSYTHLKGFYDRYLPSFSGTKIGLAYNDFIIDKVPRGKYDLSADVLITEKGITAINTK